MRIEEREYIEPESINEEIINAINTVKEYCSTHGEYEDDGVSIPQFCTSYTEVITSYEDEWEQTDNYPIQFCPHCGEKIEISVVEEIGVSDKYNELTKQRKELWKKCQRTDSKKEDYELTKQVRKLDYQIDDFYELDEWKGEY